MSANKTRIIPSRDALEALFSSLINQYGQQLYWHIRRIVVGHEDAEDVLQDTMINAYTHINRLKDASNVRAWIYRIATNEALQFLRRQTYLFQSIDTLASSLVVKMKEEASPTASQIEILFQEALLQLPTIQRVAFNMHYYDELSYEEIADITGKSIGTLKTSYHYATKKIKNYIKQHA